MYDAISRKGDRGNRAIDWVKQLLSDIATVLIKIDPTIQWGFTEK